MARPLAIWWIKRDARLGDNACLEEAHQRGWEVLPFFCFEPTILAADDTSDMHVHAQGQAIDGLRTSLRQLGAEIVIAHGEIVEKLAKLRAAVPFSALFSHEEVGNDLTFRRDRDVAAWCKGHGIEYREFPQSSVRRGGVDRERLSNQWADRVASTPPIAVPTIRQADDLRQLAAKTAFPKLKAFAANDPWQAVSEQEAQATLREFLTQRGLWYRGGISSPNTAFSAGSRLSVHLAWGTISVRQVWHAVQERLASLESVEKDDTQAGRWKQSLIAFLSRLHWRDHFTQRLESEPELEFRSLHPSYRDLAYENDERWHRAWKEGRTGYPLVDAVMRCLAATGFVNFRMRAMVVSFACHVLHLDWRLIHPHLARVFRDYDPGIHLNQLQMQAGVVGLNAIRVYNPTKQLADWDRDCRFVKRWLPELRDLSPDRILNDSQLPNYVEPIVPFRERSKQMMDMLYAIRKTAEAKAATSAVFHRHGSRKKPPTRRPHKTKRKLEPQTPSLFDELNLDE
jgi:deoxyribodipyrimidine photo-lyase